LKYNKQYHTKNLFLQICLPLVRNYLFVDVTTAGLSDAAATVGRAAESYIN